MLSSLSTTSYAATPEEVLNACDRALNAKKQEAALCGLGVKLREDEMSRLYTEVSQLKESGQSWYNNVFVWAAVGSIIGVWAGARATR